MDATSYIAGGRQVWRELLAQAQRALGYEDVEQAQWIQEREAAIAVLRSVCDEYGDNDWDEHLHLADVIEKHLWRHLD